MPPISPLGTRTGPIVIAVASMIAAVTAMIFAIYFGVRAGHIEDDSANFRKKYIGVVAEAQLNSPQMEALKTAKETEGSPYPRQAALMDVALQQTQRLAELTAGPGTEAETAIKTGATTIDNAQKKLQAVNANVSLPPGNLSGAVNELTNAVVSREAQVAQLQQHMKDSEALVAAAKKQVTDLTAAKDAEVDAARADARKVTEDAQADRASLSSQVQTIEQSITQERESVNQERLNNQSTVVDLQARVRTLQKDLDATRARINRGSSTNDPVIRHVDGHVVRVPGGGIVYVSLGAGDQMSPGLTFEVYERADGVPPAPAGALQDEQIDLPKGKASIEVTRVGATSSEARVIRQTPGMTISEGDVIANLVYDPNTRFRFMVYGNFDLDHNGISTPGDAEVIKQLVTQWGGRLTDQVNVDTDFIVLGQVPELPAFSRDELEDPINRRKFDDAQTALNAYQEIVQKAQTMNIPILNQNRFLYYIGYYEQAQK